MTILSGTVVVAVLIAAFIIMFFAVRRRSGDIWDWSEDAYTPQRTQPHDAPRAVTRIRSKNVYWEIN